MKKLLIMTLSFFSAHLHAPNFYQDLGVLESASQEEIKKAYKKLAKQFHPDKNLNNLVEAKKRFQQVGTAFQFLSNVQAKYFYDA